MSSVHARGWPLFWPLLSPLSGPLDGRFGGRFQGGLWFGFWAAFPNIMGRTRQLQRAQGVRPCFGLCCGNGPTCGTTTFPSERPFRINNFQRGALGSTPLLLYIEDPNHNTRRGWLPLGQPRPAEERHSQRAQQGGGSKKVRPFSAMITTTHPPRAPDGGGGPPGGGLAAGPPGRPTACTRACTWPIGAGLGVAHNPLCTPRGRVYTAAKGLRGDCPLQVRCHRLRCH